MKIGFSNMVIAGLSENCFVREEGQVPEWNIFYKVSCKDSFMVLGIFAVSIFAIDVLPQAFSPHNLLAVRQFCCER